MPPVAETKPIPVRLGAEAIQRLDSFAGRIGHNRAAVIRLLIKSWLDDFEKNGKASLPPDWEQIMASQDGRSAVPENVTEMAPAAPAKVAEDAAEPFKSPPRKPTSYRKGLRKKME